MYIAVVGNLYNMPQQKKCHGLPIPRKSALKGM